MISVNYDESVPVSELLSYGAKVFDRLSAPKSEAVFGIAGVAINGTKAAPVTVYINNSTGNVGTTATVGHLIGRVECKANVGEGVWVKIAGLVSNGVFITETVYST